MKVLSRLLCLVLCVPLLVMGQEKITWEKDNSQMVLIPGSSFEMGDHFNEEGTNERPVHTVTLDEFYMDSTEVTNGQYRVFMEQTGHREPRYWTNSSYNQANQPVVGVGWNDATAYAATAEKANYDRKVSKPTVVGSYPANGYGLYDMAGNVWEWCQGWYGKDYYQNSPAKNPPGPGTGLYRVLRGGSWNNNSRYLRVADRNYNGPNNRGDTSTDFDVCQDRILPLAPP